MPKLAQVLVASGDPKENARLERMLVGEDFGCLTADGAAEVGPLVRERRPDAALLGDGLGETALGELIDALKGDPEAAQVPIMLVAGQSSDALRRTCVEKAVEDGNAHRWRSGC